MTFLEKNTDRSTANLRSSNSESMVTQLYRKLAKQPKTKGSYQLHCLRMGTHHQWRPKGLSVLRPVLFIIYINDIDIRLNKLVSMFADNKNITNLMITNHNRMSLKEDLRKISKWSQRWQMPFNVKKCHILQLGT